MKRIFELEPSISVARNSSYLRSYPFLVSYFAERPELGEADVVRGSHMVYGWMPTILDLDAVSVKGTSLPQAASLLNEAKKRDLTHAELAALKGVINNSIVGASKLLHFVAPDRYPIWDSRIYLYCNRRSGHAYQVNNIDAYLAYRSELQDLIDDERFFAFHASVNDKVGYPVSKMRAAELMMFLAAVHFGTNPD